MELIFKKISEFEKGLLFDLLADAYSFDSRYSECWSSDWKDFEDFLFDHPDIADKYGFVTVLEGKPIGHISWDPRNMPEYVQIGHNCIAAEYKGFGYGKKQLQEAVLRISRYDKVNKIIVQTNRNLVARYNYESVGFQLCQTKENTGISAFSGDYLDYELNISV